MSPIYKQPEAVALGPFHQEAIPLGPLQVHTNSNQPLTAFQRHINNKPPKLPLTVVDGKIVDGAIDPSRKKSEVKYSLSNNTKWFMGRKLHQIKSEKYFTDGQKSPVGIGALGGWIEKKENLSQYGLSWISIGAHVFDDAQVIDNAYVGGSATVFGNAVVKEDAKLVSDVMVFDNAIVGGQVTFGGKSFIYDNAVIEGEIAVRGSLTLYGNVQLFGKGELAYQYTFHMNKGIFLFPGESFRSPLWEYFEKATTNIIIKKR
jgi:hypothetical protein